MKKIKSKVIACFLVALLVLPLAVGCACMNKRLDTPGRFSIDADNGIISWEVVDNAVSYKVKADKSGGSTKEYDVDTNIFSLAVLETGKYIFSVMAIAGEGANYRNSKWGKSPAHNHVATNILLIDGEGDSDYDVDSIALAKLAKEELGANVTVVSPFNAPTTLEALNNYKEVILMNVDNTHLANGFEDALESYVNAGGGLFAIGGDNAFDPDKMNGSLLEELMPIVSENYRAPSASYLLIDNSDDVLGRTVYVPSISESGLNISEDMEDMLKLLEVFGEIPSGYMTLHELLTNNMLWAIIYLASDGQLDGFLSGMVPGGGDMNIASFFREVDLMGMIAIGNGAREVFPLTPVSGPNLTPSIAGIGNGGTISHGFTSLPIENGTPNISAAIGMAFNGLQKATNLGLKQILVISDGKTSSTREDIMSAVSNCKNALPTPIQVSTMVMGETADAESTTLMEDIASEEHGNGVFVDSNIIDTTDPVNGYGAIIEMFSILLGGEGVPVTIPAYSPKNESKGTPAILVGVIPGDIKFTNYNPVVAEDGSIILSGVFGQPLYAQGAYGQGKVGCLMTDLKNTPDSWSNGVLDTGSGRKLALNIIKELMKVDKKN